MAFVPAFVSDIPFELDLEIVSAIAAEMAVAASETQRGTVNVAFVDDETMRTYNRTYREKDSTTDVLSFHYFEDFVDCSEGEVAGEVILSESRIREQAPEYGNTPELETYKLLIHSFAHLLGYDHETDEEYEAMKEVEDVVNAKVSQKFGIRIG